MRIFVILPATILVALLSAVQVGAQQPAIVAFRNVNVIPMTGVPILPEQTVVVTDSVITAIGPVADARIPLFAAAGFSNMDILRIATAGAAEYLGVLDNIVEVGKTADLLMLDGDPIQNPENVERIQGVMAKGEWLPREVLTAWLREIAARNAALQ